MTESPADYPPRTYSPRTRAMACWISEYLAPPQVLLLGLTLLGLAGPFPLGLVSAAVAALFSAGLPRLLVHWGVQQGWLTDPTLSQRRQRVIVLPAVMVCVAVGLGVLVAIHAPRSLVRSLAAILVGGAVILAITTVWKISLHTGGVAAVATALALTVNPWCALALVVTVPVAWSRVALRSHTPAQTLAGALLTPLTTVLTFVFIR
jgi:membrane-associated phospholipid phosphatase